MFKHSKQIRELEKRIADLEKQVQDQQQRINFLVYQKTSLNKESGINPFTLC